MSDKPGGRLPDCACLCVWPFDFHLPRGTMGGYDLDVQDFPKPSSAHWRGLQCDLGGSRLPEQHGQQGPRVRTIPGDFTTARLGQDGTV